MVDFLSYNRRKVILLLVLFIVVLYLALYHPFFINPFSELPFGLSITGLVLQDISIDNVPPEVLHLAQFCSFSCDRGTSGRQDFCYNANTLNLNGSVMKGTCSELADLYPEYGFVRCPNFC